MAQQTVRRRPRALIILGWLMIFQGLLALLIFGSLLAVQLAVGSGIVAAAAELIGPPGASRLLLSAGAGITAIFGLVSGVGLLRMQAWAWLLALCTQGFVLAVALSDYWGGNPDYLTLALGVVQVYLLNRADVQRAVRPAGPHTARALPATPAASREAPDGS